MRDVRSLSPTEAAVTWILTPSLRVRQTRSWRARPELDVKTDRIRDSKRQTEHRVLAGPLGRGIAETSDADAARQSSLEERVRSSSRISQH
jgi:hypothetical protein